MNIMRKHCSLVLCLLAFASSCAFAQEGFPSKPIRLVIPYPAGGPADTLARLLQTELRARLGQSVIADNRGGGGGRIGVDYVVKAAPDGYTLLLGNDGPVSVNPSLYKDIKFDPIRDLIAVSQLTSSQLVLLANPASPFKTVRELVAAAKNAPGKYTFASSGSGNASHLGGELLNGLAKIELLHVPYKGAAPALADLIGGQVNLLFNNLLSGLPHVKSGKLIALAVTGPKRSSAAQDIPTMREAGIAGFEMTLWSGVFAPSATPAPIIAQLNKALVESVRAAAVTNKLVDQGVEVVASTPEAFSIHVKRETEKWGKVVRDSGAKVD